MFDVVEPEPEVVVGPVPEGLPESEQPAMAIAISGTATVKTDRDPKPDMAFMPTKTCLLPGRFQLSAHESLQQTRGTAAGLMRDGRAHHPISSHSTRGFGSSAPEHIDGSGQASSSTVAILVVEASRAIPLGVSIDGTCRGGVVLRSLSYRW